jgi:hypothetical protein
LLEEPEELRVLITTDEADEMSAMGEDLEETEDFGIVVETVLGKFVYDMTERFECVGFDIMYIPEAIGENGEMVCRVVIP